MVCFLLLILALVSRLSAKVTPDFNDCLDFFYNKTPPQGFEVLSKQNNDLVPICQMGKDYKVSFASFYHKHYRYSLYSAYILDNKIKFTNTDQRYSLDSEMGNSDGLYSDSVCSEDDIMNTRFTLEPQLVDKRLPNCTMLQTELTTAIKKLIPGNATEHIMNVQSVNADYSGSKFDRGHLNPRFHHKYPNATDTLTNVAPMNPSLNRGPWRMIEMGMQKNASECNIMFVITGVVPGNYWIPDNKRKRVNIPSNIWSAFCCRDNNDNKKSAMGFLTENNIDNIKRGLSISDLQRNLKSLLNVTNNITLFYNNCD
ncbi:uncharacterized protein LOC128643124 [Bombina bombina]|uniref:uncharacterized protein LOC128643124 n=1 Tax=Bombina bombina TaxID=8345 RepID=UPI00235B0259|nr:uncharacterized protein LOC128643124 [Bombina bombina]